MKTLLPTFLTFVLTLTPVLSVHGQDAPAKRAVLILTNHATLGDTGQATGAYLSEVTHPYEVFSKAGYELVLASPKGGEAPIDPKATTGPLNEKYLADAEFMKMLRNTVPLSEVDLAAADILFFAGGHGAMWDFPQSEAVQEAVRSGYERGAIIASVCHGPAALVDVMMSDGSFFLAGKQVAAFTNSEEEAVKLTEVVPFLLEDKMVARGATFTRRKDFQKNVVVHNRLITGQNPASATGVAEAAVALLSHQQSAAE